MKRSDRQNFRLRVINVMAISLDGKIARTPLESDSERRAYGFTNEVDREFVRGQIAEADAIITGANSMRAAKAAWEQKGRKGKYPIWLVYTTSGLEENLPFWQQDHIPRILVSKEPLPSEVMSRNPTVQNLTYGNAPPAAFVIDFLKGFPCDTVLLFGGGPVNQMFFVENLVNELKITLCPYLISGNESVNFVTGQLQRPLAWRLLSSHVVSSHVFLHYELQKNS